ncbi:MAG: hypothetical protein L0Y56_22710, partial [Nitrospira sp.]|nr:hypothetical protein [Nitrospira sp.]
SPKKDLFLTYGLLNLLSFSREPAEKIKGFEVATSGKLFDFQLYDWVREFLREQVKLQKWEQQDISEVKNLKKSNYLAARREVIRHLL